MPIRVGVISDTHDLLRSSAKEFLKGSDLIIHGGDICKESVLAELAAIAPVTAVRGNNDKGAWALELSESEILPLLNSEWVRSASFPALRRCQGRAQPGAANP